MLAVSMDDLETLKRFKASLGAPMHFVSDKDGALVRAFDVKGLLGSKRTTFVIGAGRKVLAIQEGADAMEPAGAIRACSLHRPAPAADAGVK